MNWLIDGTSAYRFASHLLEPRIRGPSGRWHFYDHAPKWIWRDLARSLKTYLIANA